MFNVPNHEISHPEHPAAVEGDNLERRLGRRVADDEQDVRTTRVQDLEEAAVVGDQHQAERISKLENMALEISFTGLLGK